MLGRPALSGARTWKIETATEEIQMRHISILTAAAAALLLGVASATEAQVQVVPYAGYQGDGNDLTVIYGGATIQKAGTGLVPFVSPFGYWLSQEIEGASEDFSTWAFAPTVGVNRIWTEGLVGVGLGYLWLEDETVGITRGAVQSGGEEGFLTNAQGEYWGNGMWHVQGLGSVNWENSYVWARGRVSRAITAFQGGNLRLGGEVLGQGNDDFSSYRAGPYLEMRTGTGFRVLLGGGAKWYEGDDDTGYWQLEVLYVPTG